MESLISVVNDLHQALSNVDSSGKEIQLPLIVVVGAQSEGKSSIIERIVGWDFLPRGEDIVTRMPLVLNIVKCPKGDAMRKDLGAEPDGEFGIFRNNPRVRNRRVGRPNRADHAGEGGWQQADHLTLALVDLPGLTELAVGDQPADIQVQIEEMVKTYISNTNAIILAVTGANIDVARSKALKLAKDVDPEGDRTLAVFTKLDIMNRGTDATDLLSGKKYPVKLGIVGVVNRSEADRDLTLEEVEANERAFLRKHYEELASRNGCEYLKKKLSTLLTAHIQKCLPDLIDRITKKKATCELDLQKLGRKVQNPDKVIFDCVHSFCKVFVGRTKSGVDVEFDVKTEQLSPAAEISTFFHEKLMGKLERIEPLKDYDTRKIKLMLKSAAGLEPDLCPHTSVIEKLISEAVDGMLAASLKCAEDVHKKLQQIFEDCDVDAIFRRFSKVRHLFRTALFEMLREQLESTKQLITIVIESHKSYINTKFPPFEKDYVQILKELAKINPDGTKKKAAGGPVQAVQLGLQTLVPSVEFNGAGGGGDAPSVEDEEEDLAAFWGSERNALFIQKVVPTYFNSIRNVVSDTVPKLIVYNMIEHLDKHLRTALSMKVALQNRASLFSESLEVEERRDALGIKMKALEEAELILDKIGTI